MGRKRRRDRTWHRYLGVVLALPLLLVSVTGVLLNHTAGLRLDERQIAWQPVLKRYGMMLAGEPTSFLAGNVTVSQWGDQCFIEATPIGASDRALVGAVSIGDQIVLAFERLPIDIYQADGLLLMQIDDTTYPGQGLARVGRAASGQLVVQSSAGLNYHFSQDLFETTLVEGGIVEWSATGSTSPALMKGMREAYRGEGVPWSRVLLDIHSGRLFGQFGPWLLDFSVLGLIVLVITGFKLSLRPSRP